METLRAAEAKLRSHRQALASVTHEMKEPRGIIAGTLVGRNSGLDARWRGCP
jgi:hypothetical protein